MEAMLKLLSKGNLHFSHILKIIIFLCTYASSLAAMEEPLPIISDYHKSIHYYGEQRITIENLQQLAEQEAPLPALSKENLTNFAEDYKELLQNLCVLSSATLWKKHKEKSKSYVDLGLIRKGNSYISSIPSSYLIKIPSACIRIINLLDQAVWHHKIKDFTKRENIKEYTFEELQRLDPTTTFQSMSRVSNFLKVRTIIKKFSLSDMLTPDIHLLPVPERPSTLEDNNYYIAQKEVLGLKRLTHTDINLLSKETITNIFLLIKHTAALHDIEHNFDGIKDKGVEAIVFCDLEQNFNSAPFTFLSDNPEEIDYNVVQGLIGLKNCFTSFFRGDHLQHMQHLRTLIENDRDLETSHYRLRLAKAFNLKK